MTKLKNSFVLAKTRELFGDDLKKWTKGALARFSLKPEEYVLSDDGTIVVSIDPSVDLSFVHMEYVYNNEINRKVIGVTATCNPDHPRAECFCVLGGVGKVIVDNGGEIEKDEYGTLDWLSTAAKYCTEFYVCDAYSDNDKRISTSRVRRATVFPSAAQVYQVNDRSELSFYDFIERLDCAVDIATKLDEELSDGDEHKG